MNKKVTTMFQMKPKNAIKLNHVELKEKVIQKEDVLPEDGLYPTLL